MPAFIGRGHLGDFKGSSMRPNEYVKRAMALLDRRPLSPETADLLARLEQLAGPGQAERFGDLWEAFYAAGGKEPE